MPNLRNTWGTPTLTGDVTIIKLEQLISSTIDGAEPFVRQVEPERVPGISDDEPQIQQVQPADTTLSDQHPTVHNVM